MHVLIGKRQIVLGTLLVMLGLAVFVNWYYTNNYEPLSPEGTVQAEEETPNGAASFVSAETAEDYFASVRLNREKTLSAALEELEAVMAGAQDGGEEAQSAREKIAALTSCAKMENDIENLVSAQVGSECVAVIGENAVEVIVPQEYLKDDVVLKVSDIIRGVCGSAYENVRVAPAML